MEAVIYMLKEVEKRKASNRVRKAIRELNKEVKKAQKIGLTIKIASNTDCQSVLPEERIVRVQILEIIEWN